MGGSLGCGRQLPWQAEEGLQIGDEGAGIGRGDRYTNGPGGKGKQGEENGQQACLARKGVMIRSDLHAGSPGPMSPFP